MNRLSVGVAAFLLLNLSGQGFAASSSELVVHEWGTFTSLQGSNGEAQEGMYHEDEPLPSFVHGRDPLNERPAPVPFPTRPRPPGRPCHGKCFEFAPTPDNGFTVTQKMETPVLYFYSPTEQHVRVDVGFPLGIISQYYPKPVEFSPAIGSVRSISGGSVRFEVDLVKGQLPVPYASPRSVYLPARKVASNFLHSGSENENLIFYRGLGNFTTGFQATSQGGGLTLVNNDVEKIRAAFLVNVTADGGSIQPLGEIPASGGRIAVSAQKILELRNSTMATRYFLRLAERQLTASLRASGLFADESEAMTNTWKTGYFLTPGLRVLYILSRQETDQILPISVQPQPKELVRTLVGRVEVLLDTDEAALVQRVRAERERFQPLDLGRFEESKLRRLLQLESLNAEEKGFVQKAISKLAKQ